MWNPRDFMRSGGLALAVRVIGFLNLIGLLVGVSSPDGGDFTLINAMVGFGWLAWEWWPIRAVRAENAESRIIDLRADEVDQQHALAAGSAPHWYPIFRVGNARLDLIGGNSASWFKVLWHVMSTSNLSTCVLDLSRYSASGSMFEGVLEAPSCLATYDPLVEQSAPAHIVAQMIATPGDFGREDDADQALLSAMDRTLAGRWSLPRLAAALAAFIGEHESRNPHAHHLQATELEFARDAQASNLMPDAAVDSARRIYAICDSLLGYDFSPVAGSSVALPWFDQSKHTVIRASQEQADQQIKRTAAMLVASLTGAIKNGVPGSPRRVVVMGADRLQRHHLDVLAATCASSGVELITAFEHFFDDALQFVGSGSTNTVILRMSTAQEAEEAAKLIGKEYKFVYDSRAHARGTSSSTTETRGQSHTRGTSQTAGTNSSTSGQMFGAQTSTSGTSSSFTTNQSSTTTSSTAEMLGENETHTDTEKRTEEFTVHPSELMSLAPTSFIYRVIAGGQVYASMGDFDPAIASSSRASAVARSDPNSWWSRELTIPGSSWVR